MPGSTLWARAPAGAQTRDARRAISCGRERDARHAISCGRAETSCCWHRNLHAAQRVSHTAWRPTNPLTHPNWLAVIDQTAVLPCPVQPQMIFQARLQDVAQPTEQRLSVSACCHADRAKVAAETQCWLLQFCWLLQSRQRSQCNPLAVSGMPTLWTGRMLRIRITYLQKLDTCNG